LHIVHSCSQSIGTGISFELLSSTELTSLFVLLSVLSHCLSFKCACKSSSLCITRSISFGIGVVDRPASGANPKIALYGDRFIPTWSRLFFWNCSNVMPDAQLVLLLSWLTMNNY
jgi:hypothetical protein